MRSSQTSLPLLKALDAFKPPRWTVASDRLVSGGVVQTLRR
jgi:hypothetical protein